MTVPTNTTKKVPELRTMCGVKAKSLGQKLHARNTWNRAQCLAYLNDGTLPTDVVPVSHEVEMSLFDQVPAHEPMAEPEPEAIADDNDLGPEWFPSPDPVDGLLEEIVHQAEPALTEAPHPDYARMTRTELEKLALKKAESEGQPVAEYTEKMSRWTNRIIVEYLEKPPPENNAPVNPSLPVTDNHSLVNPSLPVIPKKKGKREKGVPDFKNWFGRVYPSDVAYPAWKYLTKTSTDVANICRAKHDHAAHCGKKDKSGVPLFEFSFKEAVGAFNISRPTFEKSIKQLIEIGFIRYAVVDGIPQRGSFKNGRGTPAQYQLTNNWKTWSPAQGKKPNQGNMGKLAMLQEKQNPGKPVLQTLVNPSLPVKPEI